MGKRSQDGLRADAAAVHRGTSPALVLALVDGLAPDTAAEVAAEVIEAALSWAFEQTELPDEAAAELGRRLTPWAERTPHPEVAAQAREAVAELATLRVAAADPRRFADWPAELQVLARRSLDVTDPAVVDALVDALPQVTAPEACDALYALLGRARKPRKGSKARRALEARVAAVGGPRAAELLAAWGRKPKWRGTPRPDPTLPLEDRLSEWAFEADERYGVPGRAEITRQQVAMFLRMAAELCGVHTASDWEAAAGAFEAENFHGLVDGCRERAAALR